MLVEQFNLRHPFFTAPPRKDRAVIILDVDGVAKRRVIPFVKEWVWALDDARLGLDVYRNPGRMEISITRDIGKIHLPDLLTTKRLPAILSVNQAMEEISVLIATYQVYSGESYQKAKYILLRTSQFLTPWKIPADAIINSPSQPI